MLSLQLGSIFVIGDAQAFPTLADYNCISQLFEPLHDDFPKFDDLEDEDHNSDTDKEYFH